MLFPRAPVLLQHGLMTVVRSRVEVEANDAAMVEAKLRRLFDEGLLETNDVHLIERVGVGGHGGAFGQHVEPSEEAKPGVKGVVCNVGVALRGQKLQREERQEEAHRWCSNSSILR